MLKNTLIYAFFCSPLKKNKTHLLEIFEPQKKISRKFGKGFDGKTPPILKVSFFFIFGFLSKNFQKTSIFFPNFLKKANGFFFFKKFLADFPKLISEKFPY